jgi:hypothetical protein
MLSSSLKASEIAAATLQAVAAAAAASAAAAVPEEACTRALLDVMICACIACYSLAL